MHLHHNPGRKFTRCQRPTRRAFSLAELSIALGTAAIVMAAVAGLQFTTTRTAHELYGPTDARSERMAALNQIRFRLSDARIGSCTVSDEGHRIRFADPNNGLDADGNTTVTSEFYFDTEERVLYYRRDVDNDSPMKVVSGPINIAFSLGTRRLDPPDFQSLLGSEAVVTLYVQTSKELGYSDIDLRDGETVVYLRNP